MIAGIALVKHFKQQEFWFGCRSWCGCCLFYLEVPLSGEGLLADGAAERFVARVRAHVYLQGRTGWEVLIAHVTQMFTALHVCKHTYTHHAWARATTSSKLVLKQQKNISKSLVNIERSQAKPDGMSSRHFIWGNPRIWPRNNDSYTYWDFF